MTEQERIELLKAVAECAPKEMGAVYSDRTYDVGGISDPCYLSGVVSFTELPEGSPLCLVESHPYDILDGPACFAMLDAMEKAGYYTLLGWASDVENHYPVDGRYACQVINGKYDRVVEREGTTRVEAAARAFVQVFGSIDRRPGA